MYRCRPPFKHFGLEDWSQVLEGEIAGPPAERKTRRRLNLCLDGYHLEGFSYVASSSMTIRENKPIKA
jgi:hypothetical protein